MRYFTAISFLMLPFLASSYYMKIGILSNDYDTVKTGKVWSMAQNYSVMMSLEPVVQVTQWWNSLDAAGVSRSICSLVKSGADALVFLGPPRWNSLVSSYSDHLGLPFVAALDNSGNFGKYQATMLPDTSEAAADYMVHYDWDRFVFIYDSGNGADQLQKILRSVSSADFVPQIEAFWKASDAEQAYRFINELLQPTINRRIILATSEQFADQLVLKLARRDNFSVLLLTPVGTIQRSPSHGFYMLTKFSVVDDKDPVLVTLENRLKTLPSHFARGRSGKEVPDSVILHYDSSLTLNTMFNKIARERPSALRSRSNLDCLEFSGEVSTTPNYLKEVLVEHGATGRIQFDDVGRRTDYKLNIIKSTPFDIKKIGTWSSTQGLQLLPEYSARPSSVPDYASFRNNPPIKVTSVIYAPFLMRSEDGRFRGFIVDFLDELFKEIRLPYQLDLVKDSYYGRKVNGQWNGMIGEVIRGEADLAAAPLTKTTERMKVVDFSKNIMTTGLNILMKKEPSDPKYATFEPFSFLTVWSAETWVVILVVLAIYSAGSYAITRFIGAPDRVRALETKGTDNLSPCGSVWFTVGSLFCRDTGIYPRNLTHRLWTLLWWVFCIFIALLYVSMLSSSLVKVRSSVTTTFSRKTSQQILKESLDTGLPQLLLVGGGSTMYFFQTSEMGLYEQYGRYLNQTPQLKIKSYLEGLKKVRESDGKYGMIMESAMGQFFADTEPCDTVVTSGFLNTQPYALALPKNSTLKDIVDHGILILMETGRLRNLYEKWWHNETHTCEDPNLDMLPKVYNTSMTLHEVSGVFYLFILFILLSVGVAAVEYYIRTRNITMR